MGCGTNTVPGFDEVNKVIKDPALEMKMNQLLIRAEKKKLKKRQPSRA
tara:strand:+ start:974 stop:1117 length:144 start_codon:yes stop_codon:yes gene_type:complete